MLLIDFDPQGALTLSLGVNPPQIDKTIYNALIDDATPLNQIILTPKAGINLAPANIDLSGAEVDLLNEIGRERILKELIEPVQDHYDFIFIDCPPSLGLLTINALTAADGVFIPVQCQFLAFRGMQLLLRTIEKVRSRSNQQLRIVGLLPTLYDARTTHSKEVLDELRTTYKGTLIDIPIRYRVGLADAMIDGRSILDLDSNSDVSQAFRQIAEVIERG